MNKHLRFLIFVVLASLDNAAAGVVPPLYAVMARDFATSEARLGNVTAVYILIIALSAATIGYRSDQGQRKQWLFFGTVLWGVAMVLSGRAQTINGFFLWQAITAVGIGGVSAVGFSVVSDVVPPDRRGIALSLWAMAQTLGAGLGAGLATIFGGSNWRLPFFIVAAAGFVFAILYLLFTNPTRRGEAEPELTAVYATGKSYEYRISRADLHQLWERQSNRWLLLQRFFLALALGSTIWIPRWAIARVQAEGYGLSDATLIGNLFVFLFNIGGFLAIPAGHLGDRWQRQHPLGRLNLALIGLLGSIPFFVLLYFLPLRGVVIPTNDSLFAVIWAILTSLFSNGYVALAFIVAFFGVSLFAAEPPNWAALITDLNLPEQRGTIIGLSRLFSAVGNALSVTLAGLLITRLTTHFDPPTNYAVGLALFQLPLLPAAACYWAMRRTLPEERTAVRTLLTHRAQQITETDHQPGSEEIALVVEVSNDADLRG